MKMSIGSNRHARWLWLLAAAAVCGCGGDSLDRVSVGGTVTADGVPLQQGSISLTPAAGTSGPSAGATIEGGKFFIPADRGPVPGNYRVEIKAIRKTGRQIVNEHQPPPNNLIDEMEQFIPRRYNTDSTLSAQLQAGKNRDVDFQLVTKEEGNATQ